MKKTTYIKHLAFLLFSFIGIASCQSQPSMLQDLQELSAAKYEGRGLASHGGKLAIDYVSKRFEEVGIKAFNGSYRQPFSFRIGSKEIKGENVTGYIKGQSDNIIVISAHHDHLGIQDGKIYYGADDNASGVAAIIYIAQYFAKHPPQNTLVFVSFDGEESGLRGSQAFVKKAPVRLDRIKLNVNLDMVSHNDKGELYVAGTSFNPQLKTYLHTDVAGLRVISGHDNPKGSAQDNWTNQGDHGSFHAKGIPFLYFGVEDHKDYHMPTDTFENINKDFYQKAVQGILQIIQQADKGIALEQSFKKSLISK